MKSTSCVALLSLSVGLFGCTGDLNFENLDELSSYDEDTYGESADAELGSVTQGLTGVPFPPSLSPVFARCEYGLASYLVEIGHSGSVPATRYDADSKLAHPDAPWVSVYDGPSRVAFLPGKVNVTSGNSISVRARACNERGCSNYRSIKIKGSCVTKGTSGKGAGKFKPPGIPRPTNPF